MNPLKAIEKWITEHGSAASLRDHLALVKEQMADIKAKKEAAEVRASDAESKNQDLQSKLDDCTKQVKALEGVRVSLKDQTQLQNRIRQLEATNQNLESQLRVRILGY